MSDSNDKSKDGIPDSQPSDRTSARQREDELEPRRTDHPVRALLKVLAYVAFGVVVLVGLFFGVCAILIGNR
jgi:hypothetical protein